MSALHVAPVVEGHGELQAVPLLIRRLAVEVFEVPVTVEQPWRVPKGRMTKHAEMTRVASTVRARVPSDANVLVVVDADDDDPVDLAVDVVRAAGRPISCVVAVREYEAWFLAGSRHPDVAQADIERVSDAKGRVAALIGRRYSEVRDQASLTASLDLDAAAENPPSFAGMIDTLRAMIL